MQGWPHMRSAVTGPRARETITSCTAVSKAFKVPFSCPNSLTPDTPVLSPHPKHTHALSLHSQGQRWKPLTRRVLAVGEGDAGGESDVDFLLRGNSLLRVYREDMVPTEAAQSPAELVGEEATLPSPV